MRLEEVSPTFIFKPLEILYQDDNLTEDVSIEHFIDEEILQPVIQHIVHRDQYDLILNSGSFAILLNGAPWKNFHFVATRFMLNIQTLLKKHLRPWRWISDITGALSVGALIIDNLLASEATVDGPFHMHNSSARSRKKNYGISLQFSPKINDMGFLYSFLLKDNICQYDKDIA
ncbi:hypothetical protein ACJX0J_038685 [Zea mays]